MHCQRIQNHVDNAKLFLNLKNHKVVKQPNKKMSRFHRISSWLFLLVVMLSPVFAQAQLRSVKGIVTDPSGEPIIGATVIDVGNYKNGTSTDVDGSFTMKVNPDAVLRISYVGYKSEEVKIGSGDIKVVLKPSDYNLDEVVVVGYGTQRREELTSAVGSVKKEDMIQTSRPDVASMIRGKVAGLNISTPDSDPLGSSQVSLRGVTTINSGTYPLVIIDGVQGDINSVSPNDIEQIDVLKDGSAAAIYGTRGTNGVIIITTKRPKGKMKASLEFNSYVSFQKAAKKLPLLSSSEYRSYAAKGLAGVVDYGADTDWMDEILQTPFNQTYSASLKGASETTRYVVSFDYTSNEGLVKKSKVNVFYPRIYVSQSLFDNLVRIEANLNGYQKRYDTGYNSNVYQSAIIFNPTRPIKDENGNWTEISRDMIYNPVALLEETVGENKITNLRAFSTITVSPLDGLDLKYMISNETTNHTYGSYETHNHKSTTVSGQNGVATNGSSRNENLMTEITLQYSKSIKNMHNLNALVGYSWNKWTYSSMDMMNKDFSVDDYTFNNIGAGGALVKGQAGMSSNKGENKLIGMFARVNYNYDGKYFISASIRHEGSSKFGKNHKWGNFPAVSVGWTLSKESFLKNFTPLSYLKLRAGYGITGTEPGASYISLSDLDMGGWGYYQGQWINMLRPGGNPNPDIRWEKKKEFNVGLDFELLNGRIGGGIDFYNRRTDDLIGWYSVPKPPYYSGSIQANAGSINNRGLEVSLNFIPLELKDFSWTSGFTFSTNKNELVSLSNDKYMSETYMTLGNTLAPIQQPTHRVDEGGAIGNFWGYKSIDIDDDGYWIIEDKNGNPKPISEQNPDDKKVIGNGIPKYFLSWNNSFTYKRFGLSIAMRGAFDYQILNMAQMNYGAPVSIQSGDNVLRSAFDKVYGKRELASDQSLQYVSYYLQDGDFWKIDNVTLYYTPYIPNNKVINGVKIWASISNFATFTGYKGIDPEVGISGLTPGIDDRYRYPSARTFTLGINLNF